MLSIKQILCDMWRRGIICPLSLLGRVGETTRELTDDELSNLPTYSQELFSPESEAYPRLSFCLIVNSVEQEVSIIDVGSEDRRLDCVFDVVSLYAKKNQSSVDSSSLFETTRIRVSPESRVILTLIDKVSGASFRDFEEALCQRVGKLCDIRFPETGTLAEDALRDTLILTKVESHSEINKIETEFELIAYFEGAK